ncbi:MAG: SecDF P1 head subdomain-containing protein [Actinophytocola sp.]|uniref:SecDF P1 head subdomain-containing protein n=1 Tax=Actinophytocola sp. TaxID=1872138 RepID=UPI003D6B0889
MKGWGTKTFLLVAVAAVALPGCGSSEVGTQPSRTPPPEWSEPPPSETSSSGSAEEQAEETGPVNLSQPLVLARVVPEDNSATGATVRSDPEGSRLPLEKPFMTVTRLERAALQYLEYDGTWAVTVKLVGDDVTTFAQWTSEHAGEQVAILTNDQVVAAPRIRSEITAGDVTISSRYSEDEARDLLAQLVGS